MSQKIQISQFAGEMLRILDEYKKATDEDVRNAVKATADKTVDVLEDRAARYNWRNYGHKFKHKAVNTPHGADRIVHVEAPDYRLTHLLEHGHILRRGGRTVGQTEAFPHWEYAEAFAQSRFEIELKKELEQ